MKNFEEIEKYEELNNVSKKGGAVFFGSTFLSTVPVCELAEDYGLDIPVHNRSVKGMTVKDAQKLADTCVVALKPQKIFLNIGDCDVATNEENEKLITDYEWLLYMLHTKCQCKIYVLSVADSSEKAREFNSLLKQLCNAHKCEFIDLNPKSFFEKIKFYMRSQPMTFAEAMSV